MQQPRPRQQGGPQTAWYSWLSGEDLPKPKELEPAPVPEPAKRSGSEDFFFVAALAMASFGSSARESLPA